MSPIEKPIHVFPDRNGEPEWRVEYFDADGGCYVTMFWGPEAERRARAYSEAVETGALQA